jgi:hypothetical protein
MINETHLVAGMLSLDEHCSICQTCQTLKCDFLECGKLLST